MQASRARGPVVDAELAYVAVPDPDRVGVDHHYGLPTGGHLLASVGPSEQGEGRADQAGPGNHLHPGRDLSARRADGSRVDGNAMFDLWCLLRNDSASLVVHIAVAAA